MLNIKQKEAICAYQNGKNIFITGCAGTGKSYVLKEIIQYIKHDRKTYAITASTGCAAVLINGQTIHSYLGIGICNYTIEKVISNLKKNRTKYVQLQQLQVLIIDEISMIDDTSFEYISKLLHLCTFKTPIFLKVFYFIS
jgi:ATP-dependent DNA helicase PIF1